MATLMLPISNLKKAVKKLSAVSSTNTHLTTNSLSATDGDMWITVGLDLNIAKPLVVNSKLLQSIVSKLSKDVSLDAKEQGLTLRSGRFKADIPVLSETILPMPTASSLSELKLDLKTLLDLLNFAGSVTQEGVKVDHTGSVRLVARDGKLEAAATDNHRIATISVPYKDSESFSLLIPSKVTRAIKDLEGPEVIISESESAIFFRSGDTAICTRKLSKKFPEIDRVFPTAYKLEVELSVPEFLESLQRVSPAIDPESNKVVLSFGGDTLKISAKGVGEAEDEIPVSPVIPDALDEPFPLTMAANQKFITTFLLTIVKSRDTIILKANEPTKPFLLEAGDRQTLIAGMRV